MSLINRVSAFFLAALAIALVGYSAALYLLVQIHLYAQFDDGLNNALRILAASVEVELDDAKWQPAEFAVDLADLRDVIWVVSNEEGEMIDHSPGFSREDPTAIGKSRSTKKIRPTSCSLIQPAAKSFPSTATMLTKSRQPMERNYRRSSPA